MISKHTIWKGILFGGIVGLALTGTMAALGWTGHAESTVFRFLRGLSWVPVQLTRCVTPGEVGFLVFIPLSLAFWVAVGIAGVVVLHRSNRRVWGSFTSRQESTGLPQKLCSYESRSSNKSRCERE